MDKILKILIKYYPVFLEGLWGTLWVSAVVVALGSVLGLLIATFRMSKVILNDVIDWFGTDIIFSDETDNEVTARVTVNWHAMRHWALQYCRHVRILSPNDLAQTVKEDLQNSLNNYQD